MRFMSNSTRHEIRSWAQSKGSVPPANCTHAPLCRVATQLEKRKE